MTKRSLLFERQLTLEAGVGMFQPRFRQQSPPVPPTTHTAFLLECMISEKISGTHTVQVKACSLPVQWHLLWASRHARKQSPDCSRRLPHSTASMPCIFHESRNRIFQGGPRWLTANSGSWLPLSAPCPSLEAMMQGLKAQGHQWTKG